MTTERTIPIAFLRAAVAAAERTGTDVDTALRRAGVPRALLTDRRARLSPEQLADAIRWLWRFSGDEMLGMGRAKAPLGTFGLVAHALVSAPDLAAVVARVVDFRRAIPGLPELRISTDGPLSRIEFAIDGLEDPNHLYVDFTLVLLQRFSSWLIGQPLRPEVIELPYPEPDNAREYDLIFGGPVKFGSDCTAMEFSSSLGAAPVIRTTQDLDEYLKRAPTDLLLQRDYGSSQSQRVRTIVEKGLISRVWPTSEEVAQKLSISTGHLRRMLRAEGTSLGGIKEEILRDAAITALSRGTSVEEISGRLGFSEPSAFRRAFKRWTGSTPASYLTEPE